MGRIAKVLSFIRITQGDAKLSNVKVNTGGGENITCDHMAPLGDDSSPLTTDYAVCTPVMATGRDVITGYIDPNLEPKAQPGDKRIYARDGQGGVSVEVWLKNDGTLTITNDTGTIVLNPDGSFDLSNNSGSISMSGGGEIDMNGVTISSVGAVEIPLSLKVGGIEVFAHTHTSSAPGSPTGPMV